MNDLILSFLSRQWAGLPIAALPAALGGWCLAAGPANGRAWLAELGWVLLALAAVLALGALWHLVHVARVRAKYPPPGTLVDVDGHRIHVLAEGEQNGKPAVVWFAGGHAPGYAIHHMHRVFRAETRSILIDRPGTGWSDVGRFPRTTAREAEEVIAALAGAGERGPFVLVGHSFGGLLAANIARRAPQRVAALLMVDATPPDTVIYGPPIPVLGELRRGAVLNVLPRLFGIHADFAARRMRRDPRFQRLISTTEEQLGDAAAVLRALDCGTESACAGASIYAELSPAGLARVAWDTVVYEGDLGELPVLLVAPGTMGPEEFEGVARMIEASTGRPVDRTRLHRFYMRSRERYLTISSRSRRVVAPEGTTHNFPFEVPEFFAEVVRGALSGGGATA